jgi:hypothetical protein
MVTSFSLEEEKSEVWAKDRDEENAHRIKAMRIGKDEIGCMFAREPW